LSLLEALVAVSMFSVVMALVMGALVKSMEAWNKSSSQHTVEQTLFKARNALARDLQGASYPQTTRTIGPSTGTAHSDALCFLSAVDPATGEVVLHDGTGDGERGSLKWQRNILYYAAVPANHAAHFGYSCTLAASPDGIDDQCPHKILVRQVIDGPDDPVTGNEVLLTPALIAPYLDLPDNLDVSPISGPDLEQARVITGSLLTFKVNRLDPDSEIQIDLRAASIPDLQKTTPVGTVHLNDHPSTTGQLFSVFPLSL
jgi:hypothetical protein